MAAELLVGPIGVHVLSIAEAQYRPGSNTEPGQIEWETSSTRSLQLSSRIATLISATAALKHHADTNHGTIHALRVMALISWNLATNAYQEAKK